MTSDVTRALPRRKIDQFPLDFFHVVVKTNQWQFSTVNTLIDHKMASQNDQNLARIFIFERGGVSWKKN